MDTLVIVENIQEITQVRVSILEINVFLDPYLFILQMPNNALSSQVARDPLR